MAPFLSRFSQLHHWGNLPALSGVVFLMLGIVLASMVPLPATLLAQSLYPFLVIIAIATIVSACLCSQKQLRFILFSLAGYFLYTLQFFSYQVVDMAIGATGMGSHSITGTVVSPPAPDRGQISYLLKVDAIDEGASGVLKGKYFLCTSTEMPSHAHLLHCSGTIQRSKKKEHRYGYDEYTSFAARGISGRIQINKILSQHPPANGIARLQLFLRAHIVSVLKKYPNTNHRSLIRASFTGERSYIPNEIADAFAGAGLVHILALSGFHAAILTAALYALLSLFPVGNLFKQCLAIMVLWGYLFFVGPIPSLARAVIMTTAVIVAQMLQRKQYTLQTIGIAGIVWLSLSPASLFQPGFQLSYVATLGIITIYPLLRQVSPVVKNPYLAYVVKSVWLSCAVSLSAYIATLPVMLHHFGSFALHGILATMVAVPLLTFAMWAFFAALLLPAPLQQLAILFSDMMMHWMVVVAKTVSSLPGAIVRLPALHPESLLVYYGAVILLLALKRDVQRKAVLPVAAIACCLFPSILLLHRFTDIPQIYFVPGREQFPECIIRWPSGRACFVGSAGGVRSVSRWIHRLPGTSVAHWCFVDKKKAAFVDSTASGAVSRASFRGSDTVCIAGGSPHTDFAGKYLPQKNIFIVSHTIYQATLHFRDDGLSVCTLRTGIGTTTQKLTFPCLLQLQPDGLQSSHFD